MKWLEVGYSKPLNGVIKVQGSKNSSLALLAAACLSDEKVRLYKIPDIEDTRVVCEILEDIGANVIKREGYIDIYTENISNPVITPQRSSAYRASYYFIGALLAKNKKVIIGYPGGDNFVSRPIDQHIKGLEAMGATIGFFEKHYEVQADYLTGADIYFDVITCGATINLMLAAVLAKGKTVLHNAARDPEVVDTAVFLNRMGAKVHGAGTDTIRIQGVEQLGGCIHTAISDRLIAGAYLMAAGITGGRVTVEDIIPEHLEACIQKLTEIGMDIAVSENSITACGTGSIRATRIRTGMYPVFVSDYQQPMTVLLLKAMGRSVICDRIYPKRFNHCEQLNRMGADIMIRNGVARINSHRQLKGAWVHAGDIRAGISLVLAGMMAEGTTYITGVEHINRGYENILRDFKAFGVEIKLYDGNESLGEIYEDLLLKGSVKV